MIAGHNGHIGKKESMYKNMGENLLEELTLEQRQKLLTLPAELKHFT